MISTRLPEANVRYGKPAEWTDEQCGTLEVHEGPIPVDAEGNVSPCCVSKWVMTDEEFEVFKETRELYLSVFFLKQMPVSISATNPIPKSKLIVVP